jgi:hypothetical protein
VRNCVWLAIPLLVWSVSAVAQEQSGSHFPESTLPLEAWNVLQSNISIVTRVRDFPESMRTALAKALRQDKLEMGDRNHGVKPRCPDCVAFRLIFGGVSPEGCFVHYSATGFAPSFNIIVFDTVGQEVPRAIWRARGNPASNLDELRALIGEGKFHSYHLPKSPSR